MVMGDKVQSRGTTGYSFGLQEEARRSSAATASRLNQRFQEDFEQKYQQSLYKNLDRKSNRNSNQYWIEDSKKTSSENSHKISSKSTSKVSPKIPLNIWTFLHLFIPSSGHSNISSFLHRKPLKFTMLESVSKWPISGTSRLVKARSSPNVSKPPLSIPKKQSTQDPQTPVAISRAQQKKCSPIASKANAPRPPARSHNKEHQPRSSILSSHQDTSRPKPSPSSKPRRPEDAPKTPSPRSQSSPKDPNPQSSKKKSASRSSSSSCSILEDRSLLKKGLAYTPEPRKPLDRCSSLASVSTLEDSRRPEPLRRKLAPMSRSTSLWSVQSASRRSSARQSGIRPSRIPLLSSRGRSLADLSRVDRAAEFPAEVDRSMDERIYENCREALGGRSTSNLEERAARLMAQLADDEKEEEEERSVDVPDAAPPRRTRVYEDRGIEGLAPKPRERTKRNFNVDGEVNSKERREKLVEGRRVAEVGRRGLDELRSYSGEAKRELEEAKKKGESRKGLGETKRRLVEGTKSFETRRSGEETKMSLEKSRVDIGGSKGELGVERDLDKRRANLEETRVELLKLKESLEDSKVDMKKAAIILEHSSNDIQPRKRFEKSKEDLESSSKILENSRNPYNEPTKPIETSTSDLNIPQTQPRRSLQHSSKSLEEPKKAIPPSSLEKPTKPPDDPPNNPEINRETPNKTPQKPEAIFKASDPRVQGSTTQLQECQKFDSVPEVVDLSWKQSNERASSLEEATKAKENSNIQELRRNWEKQLCGSSEKITESTTVAVQASKRSCSLSKETRQRKEEEEQRRKQQSVGKRAKEIEQLVNFFNCKNAESRGPWTKAATIEGSRASKKGQDYNGYASDGNCSEDSGHMSNENEVDVEIRGQSDSGGFKGSDYLADDATSGIDVFDSTRMMSRRLEDSEKKKLLAVRSSPSTSSGASSIDSCREDLAKHGQYLEREDWKGNDRRQIFFRSGTLERLEAQRDEKLTGHIILLQARCRGYLARRKLNTLKLQDLAVRCIQRNVRKLMSVREWPWWRLYVKVAPLLNVHRTEDQLKARTEELEILRAKVERLEQERNHLKHDNDKLEAKVSSKRREYF
ncbi:hypothetical protein KM043_003453 [Ampulex compressa]|nr:hypothetical protein KM043_003453 [Ampulex compressa]